MTIDKPTKDFNEFLPNGFGTASGVVKNDFDDNKKLNGFDANNAQILQGDNLNYMLDTMGKQLKYLTTVIDYILDINAGYIPYINSNGQLDNATIDTLLPSQTGNSGKLLTTNGTNCSWSSSIKEVGDLYFTSNFNKELAENECWLDGTEGENHDGVVPTTGKWATLFSIYGWIYDTSYINTNYFKLPDFTNKCVWGGTSAGYISAGLPTLLGETDYNGNHSHNTFEAGNHSHTTNETGNHSHTQTTTDQDDFGSYITSGTKNGTRTVSTASAGKHSHTTNTTGKHSHNTNTAGNHNHNITVTSNISGLLGGANTVQPPAIKVKVYTRVY